MRAATGSDEEHRRGLEDAPVARSGVLRQRVCGIAAIAFGVLVAIENAVLAGAAAPTFADPIEQVLAHYHNRGAVAIAVGLVAVYLPLLLVFLTGLHGLVGRRGGAGVDWSRVGVAAGAVMTLKFSAPSALVTIYRVSRPESSV